MQAKSYNKLKGFNVIKNYSRAVKTGEKDSDSIHTIKHKIRTVVFSRV